MLLKSVVVHFLRQGVLSMFDTLRLTDFDLHRTDLLTRKHPVTGFIIWSFGNTIYSHSVQKLQQVVAK